MKKLFTPTEIRRNRGCYSLDDVNALSFIKQDSIHIVDILNSEINIKDKRWFLHNSCKLTLPEKKALCLALSWAVLPIFETRYPNDKRVRECLEAIEKFIAGTISQDDLLTARRAAYAAYAAADAAYAADAAAAAYAAYAADAADAADAAAYAADAAASYSDKLKTVMINFVNNLPE